MTRQLEAQEKFFVSPQISVVSANAADPNTGNFVFSFVDLKDPFTPSEIAGEDLPGPILLLMGARQFKFRFLSTHLTLEPKRSRLKAKYLEDILSVVSACASCQFQILRTIRL